MKSQQLRNRIWPQIWPGFQWRWRRASLVLRTHCSPFRWAVHFVVYVGCTVFVWVLLSENLHLDGFRSGWRLPALVSHLLLAVGVLMVLLLAVGNVSERYVGKLTLSVFSLFLLIGFLGIRGFALRRYCSATGLDRSTALLSWVLTVWPPNWR